MAFRNPLGSISALSLAATPEALIPAAIVAGAAVTVGATAATYKAYKDYEEKKHRNAIERINRLHEIHLAKIRIHDYNEIQGFPPLFKLIPGKDSSSVESMHMTEDQIRKIGTVLPSGSDIALSTYREAISDAISKLKAYYFSRKEKNDITAGVTCYLLYMLETKCLNFAGYTYDIAYLNAISNFIIAYASNEGRENSQHFSRLGPVYQDLISAKQMLEEHKLKLSLEDLLTELKDACNYKSKQLIRLMAKIIVKDKYWELIDTVTMTELRDGILRREYIKSEIKGLVFKKDDEVKLDESIFRNWLTSLANFYVQTLDPDSKIVAKEIKSPTKLFAVPNYARLVELKQNKKNLSKEHKEELKLLEDDFEKTSNAFLEHHNFLTTKLDPKSKNKDAKMMPVTDPADIATRLQVFSNFATLLHQIISLQHLCTHILKSTKQLGELYVKNPHHFVRVFLVLDELCNLIKDNITQSKNDLTEIQKSDMNTLQLESQEVLPNLINELLDSAFSSVSTLGAKIKDYRYRVANNLNPNEPTYHSVKLEMFEVTGLLAKIYNITTEPPKATDSLSQPESSEQRSEKHKHRHKNKDKNPAPIVETTPLAVTPRETDTLSRSTSESDTATKTKSKSLFHSISMRKLKEKKHRKPSMPQIEISAPISGHPASTATSSVVNPVTMQPTTHTQPVIPIATLPASVEKIEPAVSTTVSGIQPEARENTHSSKIERQSSQSVRPIDLHADSADVEAAVIDEVKQSAPIDDVKSNEEKLTKVTTTLLTALTPSHTNTSTDEETLTLDNLYRELKNTIDIMNQKTLTLMREPNKSESRQKKADQSFELYLDLMNKLLTFIQLPADSRKKGAATLTQEVHDTLSNPDYAFIDEHYNGATRAMYSLTKFGVFQTDSRKKYTQLNNAIDKLVDHYYVTMKHWKVTLV